jgi:hypothetical protein
VLNHPSRADNFLIVGECMDAEEVQLLHLREMVSPQARQVNLDQTIDALRPIFSALPKTPWPGLTGEPEKMPEIQPKPLNGWPPYTIVCDTQESTTVTRSGCD